MNLERFNDLVKNAKENNIIQNFVKELGEYVEKNITNRVDLSLLDKMQKETDVTSEYRDKMYIERQHILQNYVKENSEEGTLYYIYGKSGNHYLISICEEEKSHEIIKIAQEDLPPEAGIDSILKVQDGRYILDNKATKSIKEEMTQKFNELLKEQLKKMEEQRVEGHIYEYVEGSKKSIWLLDNTKNNGKIFQEFKFQSQVFENAKEGDLFQYENGEYRKYL